MDAGVPAAARERGQPRRGRGRREAPDRRGGEPARKPSVGRLRGRLRIAGGAYADDTGPVIGAHCHFGDGLSRWARGQHGQVGELLDAIAAAGYVGVRTWTVLGGSSYWVGREIGPETPGYWRHVTDYAAALEARGLRWLVSQGDLLRLITTTDGRTAYMRRLVSVLPRDVVAGVDCGNEAGNNGEADPRRLVPLAEVVAIAWPDVPLVLSSSQTEERADIDAWSALPSTHFDVHGHRGGHYWDKVRHIFSVAYEGQPVRHHGAQSEPFGPGQLVSASENKHELDAAVCELGAVVATMSRQWWTWFSGPGVKSDAGEDLRQMPGFATVPAAVALLPADVMTWPTLCHGGASQLGKRVYAVPGTDETRADHALSADGRFVAVLYGPRWRECYAERPHRVEAQRDCGDKGRLIVGRV